MPELERNGLRLWYEDDGAGPPVMLIHGLLLDRTMFASQVDALRDRYRFVTPDCRGHGRSGHRAEEHTQWDIMEDHVALLDHLGIDRVVWGGVSMGGFHSLRAALRHPERVAGLVLIDTQAGAEDEARGPMYEAFAEVVATEGFNDDIGRAAAMAIFGVNADPRMVDGWIERWRAEPTEDVRERLRAVTRREDITDRLGEISAPAIVIHGEDDLAIDMERAEQLAAGLSGLVDFVRIPGAGHSSTIERPGPVTEALERFLTGLGRW